MPPSLCCAHCNPKPKGTCCDFCSPSLTAELFSSIPSKVPQSTMYHTPKYEKTQADKDLLWAIDSWRHEHDLVGSSSILSDSIIKHCRWDNYPVPNPPSKPILTITMISLSLSYIPYSSGPRSTMPISFIQPSLLPSSRSPFSFSL